MAGVTIVAFDGRTFAVPSLLGQDQPGGTARRALAPAASAPPCARGIVGYCLSDHTGCATTGDGLTCSSQTPTCRWTTQQHVRPYPVSAPV